MDDGPPKALSHWLPKDSRVVSSKSPPRFLDDKKCWSSFGKKSKGIKFSYSWKNWNNFSRRESNLGPFYWLPLVVRKGKHSKMWQEFSPIIAKRHTPTAPWKIKVEKRMFYKEWNSIFPIFNCLPRASEGRFWNNCVTYNLLVLTILFPKWCGRTNAWNREIAKYTEGIIHTRKYVPYIEKIAILYS